MIIRNYANYFTTQIGCVLAVHICVMITYKVQPCGSEFILRHPDHCLPLLQCKTQQEVIDKLPEYFKKLKDERCKVQIIDAMGNYEYTLEFPLPITIE